MRSRFCGDGCTGGITSNTFRVVSGYGNAIARFLEVSRNKRSLSPSTQGSHIPVGAGSTAYIILHQQLYKPAPVF
ncbi:hypothetical protein POG23_10465 [Limnoraphis robusta]|nr:hypothetical protein [Limnoraphis robusta]